LTGHHRAALPVRGYLRWFYSQATTVLARSSASVQRLSDLGVAKQKVRVLPAAVDGRIFKAQNRDPELWAKLGVDLPHRLLYCGRISVEKNLAFLAQTFALLCARRRDTALVLAGSGPYLPSLRKMLAGRPAFFLGYQDDAQLGRLDASADLLVFPSCTDTLGQVVLEAQASGLPALVSDAGGPGQIVEHAETGWVLRADAPAAAWCDVIEHLLDNPEMRRHMAEQSIERSQQRTPGQTAEVFWSVHVRDDKASIRTPFSPSPLYAGERAG
jgi:glycosyltransferase involved in cell wall biosynthesis